MRQAAIAGVRRAVGGHEPVRPARKRPGRRVTDRAAALIQGELNRARAGVSVVSVQLREVQPPDSAQAAFHDLAAASGEAQAGARDAGAYRERVLAAARADAVKTVQISQGYRDQEISEARGEGRALRPGRRPVSQGAAGNARPPLHGDHGARAAQHAQGDRPAAQGRGGADRACRRNLLIRSRMHRLRPSRRRPAPTASSHPQAPSSSAPDATAA